jgi:hypothetical protein
MEVEIMNTFNIGDIVCIVNNAGPLGCFWAYVIDPKRNVVRGPHGIVKASPEQWSCPYPAPSVNLIPGARLDRWHADIDRILRRGYK